MNEQLTPEEISALRALMPMLASSFGKAFVQERKTITLAKAIAAAVESKQNAGCSPQYVTTLRQYWNQFARGREKFDVAQIKPADIERWFTHRQEPAATRAGNIGRLSALFDWCWRMEYIEANPVDRVERPRILRPVPKILTVDETEKLMDYVYTVKPNQLQYFALTIFAGLRPNEARQISWGDINFDTGRITVAACVSKVRQRRIVTPHANCMEWLKAAYAKKAGAMVHLTTSRRWIRHVKRHMGWAKFPQDIFRHTAASYWLAECEDASKVSLQLGHSVKMLMTHYRDIVTKADAERFWAIRPPAQAEPAPKPEPKPKLDVSQLSERRREILRLAAEGKTARQIGAALGITRRTVEEDKRWMMHELRIFALQLSEVNGS